MARKKLIRTKDFPYHIYARTNNQDWFIDKLDDIWSIYCDLLCILHYFYGCKIHSFIMMNNHFHLLISTPCENIDDCMLYFMRESAREINLLFGKRSRVYGGRYKWSLIDNDRYYYLIMKYIYMNPLKANMCAQVESYPYSTLRMKVGLSKLDVPLSPFFDEFYKLSHPFQLVEYCNQGVSKSLDDVITKALSKPIFKISSRVKKDFVNELEKEAVGRKK